MTDCLVAGENRAGLLLISGSPPLPARFFPAPRRAALPPRRPLRLLCPVLRTSVWVPWSIAERFPLFPSSSTLPRRSASPRFHDGLPHCRREPCRASTILRLSTAPGTLLSCTSARCTTSPAASTSSLPRAAHARLVALFFHVSRTLISALFLVGYIPSWYNTFDRARPPQHSRPGILYIFLAGLIT